MNKIILTTIFLTMSASLMTAQAAVKISFADQLMMQKKQLHPQEFNFFSDVYKQVTVQQQTAPSQPVAIEGEKLSFKMQLDSQKQLLRHHKFYPVSDAYYQIISRSEYELIKR